MHDDAVVIAHVRGRDLEVVDRGHDVEFEFFVRGRLEDARVDFDFFHTWAVQFFEGGNDAGFLAGARGAVDEEMGKIAGLCLGGDWGGEFGIFFDRVQGKDLRGSGDVWRGRRGRTVGRETAVCVYLLGGPWFVVGRGLEGMDVDFAKADCRFEVRETRRRVK